MLSIIVPVFNEEKNINEFLNRLVLTLEKINEDYEVIFILDPSTDKTEELILDQIKKNNKIKLIVFSRRFGQPSATMAGIHYASGERCAIIDCDLQDPPELIFDMNKKMNEGFDVVLARRRSRKGETFIKKIITKIGYEIIEKITDIKIPKNTGDFRIISKRVIENLKKFNEPNAFLRGLVAYIGFKHSFIDYDREKRFRGISKYNKYLGSIQIAFNGIFGFSSRPLFIMSVVGFAFVNPSISALLSKNASPDQQGEVLGVNQSFASLGRILGPFLGSVLFSLYDSRTLPFLMAVMVLFAVLFLLRRVSSVAASANSSF